MAEFPGHRYHPSGAVRLFQSEEEMQAAGPGWRDIPYAKPATASSSRVCESCARLVNENAAMRKQFDASWRHKTDECDSLRSHAVILEETNRQLSRQVAEMQGKLAALEATAQAEAQDKAPEGQSEEPPQATVPSQPEAQPEPAVAGGNRSRRR